MKKIGFLVITVMFCSYSFVNASERYGLQGYKLTVISTDVQNTYNATSKEVLLNKLTLLEYINKKDISTAYRELSKKYTVAKDEDIEIEEALI